MQLVGTNNSVDNVYKNPANIDSALSNANLAADITSLYANFPIVTETGTSKTLALTDRNTYQRVNNGSTITITVPPASSVAFPVDGATVINFTQVGAGQITFAEGSGVTINSYLDRVTTPAPYAGCSLVAVSTDVWDLVGTLI